MTDRWDSSLYDDRHSFVWKKGADLIVANDVSAEAGVMGGDRNRVTIVSASGAVQCADWRGSNRY